MTGTHNVEMGSGVGASFDVARACDRITLRWRVGPVKAVACAHKPDAPAKALTIRERAANFAGFRAVCGRLRNINRRKRSHAKTATAPDGRLTGR
jgi:hypothetical protein